MAKQKRAKPTKLVVHELPTVKGALGRLGMNGPNPATLMVTASTISAASPEQVWETWSEIEKWSSWGNPFTVNARWLERRAWEVGAKFEQTVSWGFPFGTTVSIDIVKEVNPGQSVSWWKAAKGIRSCHIWFFEPLTQGGTRIVKTEVFVGSTIFLTKPFIKSKWTRLFQQSVDSLARASERAQPKTQIGTVFDTISS